MIKCFLKIFLIYSFGDQFFVFFWGGGGGGGRGTICAILVEDIMRNISVKLF